MKNNLFLSSLFALVALFGFSQGPTADFVSNIQELCVGDQLSFTDLSTQGTTPIVQWTWDFGDGNGSNNQNPTHVYSLAGTYTISLVVTDQNGFEGNKIRSLYITVNDLPGTFFTATSLGCTVPGDVSFNNQSPSGAQYQYAWDFGNGNTSSSENPGVETYSTAGTYTISLAVTNLNTGCDSTYTTTIDIIDYQNDFTAPANACLNDLVNFTDNSPGSTTSWSWNFGDGGTSTAQNPTHAYVSPGIYTVQLVSMDAGTGCSSTITHDIEIFDLPTPAFTASSVIGCAPFDVTFTNDTPGGASYSWDFGDGMTSNQENPSTVTYNNEGFFDVTLTMEDGNGCVNSTTVTNYIEVSSPVVNITLDPLNGCEPLDVQFNDLSVSQDPGGDPITGWLWTFGDGNTSTDQNPINTYNEGVYTVELTVTTQNGCSATATYTDTIEVGSKPIADFTVAPPIDCAKAEYQFTDLTVIPAGADPNDIEYQWDYGDGGTGSEQNPMYEYPQDTGYFDVTQIVTWRGCSDTMIKPQFVYVKAPISLFTPSQMVVCNPASFPVVIDFADNAIIGQASDDVLMIWDWNDGSTTTLDDPDLDPDDDGSESHSFMGYGSFTVQQAVYNTTTGCEDSTTQTIVISQIDADFTMVNDSACVNSLVSFSDNSTSTEPITNTIFNMGNGANLGGPNINYAYPTSGSYDITLTATNSVGCQDQQIFSGFDALALPNAVIDPTNVGDCAPVNVVFSNASTTVGNGVPLDHFDWTFPDASTQTTNGLGETVNYNFDAEGSFLVSMIAVDEFGCVSSPTNSIVNITKPTADFSISPVICNHTSFIGTNQSVNGVLYEWQIDGVSTSTDPDLSHQFDEFADGITTSSTHDIALIAEDINGCKDTLIETVTVSLPFAKLDYDLDGAAVNANGEFTCPPVFADFFDNSTSFGAVNTWQWNFGNGNASILQSPQNTYILSGTYSATLTITDEYGCSDDTTLFEFLTIFGPSGEGDWTSQGGLCGQIFDFNAQNLQDVENYFWTLGDGTVISNQPNYEHTYLDFGSYDPTLTIQDALGCTVVLPLNNINVSPNNVDAEYTVSPTGTNVLLGTDFTFTDISTSDSPITVWDWDFGDGSGFNSVEEYSFNDPGYHTVILTVTDANGCVGQYVDSVFLSDGFTLPNIITANEDGTNDLFVLPADFFDSFDIIIINRWGNVVYESYGATGTFLWDGTNKGGEYVSEGTYFYKLTGTYGDNLQAFKQGFVQVVRD